MICCRIKTSRIRLHPLRQGEDVDDWGQSWNTRQYCDGRSGDPMRAPGGGEGSVFSTILFPSPCQRTVVDTLQREAAFPLQTDRNILLVFTAHPSLFALWLDFWTVASAWLDDCSDHACGLTPNPTPPAPLSLHTYFSLCWCCVPLSPLDWVDIEEGKAL